MSFTHDAGIESGIDSSSLFSIVFLGGILATEIFLFTKIFLDRVLPSTNKDSKEKTKEDRESEYEDIFDDLISSNRQVIIVRGVPGVGKRTFIDKLVDYSNDDSYQICDSNDYFMQDDKYLFNGKDIAKADEHCFNNFIDAIKEQKNIIYVSGHFYEKWMYKKYINISKLKDYEYRVVTIKCNNREELQKFNRRSIHNVPYSRSVKIYENWEDDKKELVCNADLDKEEEQVNDNEECLIETSDEEYNEEYNKKEQ